MSEESARIIELENQLEKVVRYLQALPVHPMTYQVIKESESVLNRSSEPEVLIGGLFTPAGILVLGAKVSGSTIIVKTAVPAIEGLQEKHKNGVYRSLVAGRKLPLLKKTETVIFGDNFFSILDDEDVHTSDTTK